MLLQTAMKSYSRLERSSSAFLFAVNVWVGGLGFLGKLWSSILSSCLMEQDASVDNVMGCEGVGRLCFCQTGVTGLKLGDFSLNISQRRQIEKGRGKNPGKQFMFVTWFSLTRAARPYQPLAVFLQFLWLFFFFFFFFSCAPKPADLSLPS